METRVSILLLISTLLSPAQGQGQGRGHWRIGPASQQRETAGGCPGSWARREIHPQSRPSHPVLPGREGTARGKLSLSCTCLPVSGACRCYVCKRSPPLRSPGPYAGTLEATWCVEDLGSLLIAERLSRPLVISCATPWLSRACCRSWAVPGPNMTAESTDSLIRKSWSSSWSWDWEPKMALQHPQRGQGTTCSDSRLLREGSQVSGGTCRLPISLGSPEPARGKRNPARLLKQAPHHTHCHHTLNHILYQTLYRTKYTTTHWNKCRSSVLAS